jgi:hypothetical protein
LQEVYEKYRDRADFYWIYVREAHPSDGERPAKHVRIAQPKTFGERAAVATTCSGELKVSVPLLVDDLNDTVAKAYDALPDRLFILRADAKIAYRGAPGPRGFNVDEMEKALAKLLQEAKPVNTGAPGG